MSSMKRNITVQWQASTHPDFLECWDTNKHDAENLLQMFAANIVSKPWGVLAWPYVLLSSAAPLIVQVIPNQLNSQASLKDTAEHTLPPQGRGAHMQ